MRKVFKLAILVILSGSVFYGFWIFGKIPFPGDYMLAWYEPWKTTTQKDSGDLGIPHKPVLDDVFRQLYPYKTLLADMLKKGEFPLWNPYNGSGTPLMAVMHAGFITPLIFIFILFPYPIAWGIYIALQPFLIAVCTYLYCKKIGLKSVSSVFTVSVVIFSGFFVVRYGYGEYLYVTAGLPFLLYVIESVKDNPKHWLQFTLPLAIAFIVFSGQPQMILYTVALSVLYAWFRLRSKAIRYLPIAFLGLGLTAVQVLPTAELYFQSNMTASASQFIFNRFLMPVSHLITLVIPNFFGNPSTYNYWGYADYVETACYIGLIPLFFALASTIFIRVSRLVLFWALVAGISTICTLNIPLIKTIYQLGIPLISTGIPTRIYVITTFAISILAGYGFDALIQNDIFKKNLKKFIIIGFILVSIVVINVSVPYVLHTPCPPYQLQCRIIALRNTGIELLAFTVCMLVFLPLYFFRRSLFVRLMVPVTIIVIISSIGIYNAQKFIPYTKHESVMPSLPLLDQLTAQSDFGRVIGIGDANVKTDYATYYHFYDPQQYDPLSVRRYAEFISFANTGIFPPPVLRSDIEIDTHVLVSAEISLRRDRLLDALSVSTLLIKNNTLWETQKNTSYIPHANSVSQYEVISEEQMILNRFFDPAFNPVSTAILEKPIPNNVVLCDDQSEIIVKEYQENSVVITSSSSCPKILILSDTYYPGWKAYVDGKETPIYRANYTFRAIVIPSGNSVIKFSYEPVSFKVGLIISILSLTLLIYAIIRTIQNGEIT